MKPRVKLLTVWIGDKPEWFDRFLSRVVTNPIVDWIFFRTDLDWLNRHMTNCLGVPCCKGSDYAAGCEYRPFYGTAFRELIGDAEWWGWVDLDVVLGDLNTLLPPLLDAYDVISTAPDYLHGPFALFRNVPEVNDLWRGCGAEEVLADPDYWNFDEVGFNPDADPGRNGNPNMTKLLRGSGLKVHWDDRCWTEGFDPVADGLPSRGCELRGAKLLEVPTGRELLAYHFTSKRWPTDDHWYNTYPSLHRLQRRRAWVRRDGVFPRPPDPPETPEYWSDRVTRVLAEGGEVHRTVLDTPVGDWERIQEHSARVILPLLRDKEWPYSPRIIDAGCGYGALFDCLPPGVAYTGVDSSPAMISLASRRLKTRVGLRFAGTDIRTLPFPDDSFDLAVCRGLEGTCKVKLGNREWNKMKAEILRVSPRLLAIDYSLNHRMIER